MMMTDARTQRIKEFFDQDSVQYVQERYPTEPRNCDQFSYIVRKKYVLEMLDRTGPAGRLLDLGCGPAILTRDLAARGWRVSGMDLSSGMLAAASRSTADLVRGSARFTAGEATRLPFQTGSFNTVLCIGVVSYIDDVSVLLNEVHRVLKPGGQAIFQISNASSIAGVDAWLWHQIRKFQARYRQLDAHDSFRTAVKLHWNRPGAFNTWCRAAGLSRREFRFYDFRPPVAIDRLSQSTALAVGKKLEAIGGSALSTVLASGYLVRVARS